MLLPSPSTPLPNIQTVIATKLPTLLALSGQSAPDHLLKCQSVFDLFKAARFYLKQHTAPEEVTDLEELLTIRLLFSFHPDETRASQFVEGVQSKLWFGKTV